MFILAPAAGNTICTTEMQNIIAIAGFVLKVIQWAVPVILIFLGTMDLVKAVMAGKEDDIKKNQGVLIKRVIAAVIVFLIPLIVGLVTGLLGADDWKSCWNTYRNSPITGLLN